MIAASRRRFKRLLTSAPQRSERRQSMTGSVLGVIMLKGDIVTKPIILIVAAFLFGTASAYAQMSSLFQLAKDGTPESIQAAISNGADVNASDKYGLTPLMIAARFNTIPEVITTLLRAGAVIEARGSDGSTPLMYAAGKNQNPEVITALLKAGADIGARDANGTTPLLAAALSNPNPMVITTLLKAGADIGARNRDGSTVLMAAAGFNQNPEVVLTLLKAGADGKAKSKEGKTAFDYAQYNEKLKGTDAYWKLNEAQY